MPYAPAARVDVAEPQEGAVNMALRVTGVSVTGRVTERVTEALLKRYYPRYTLLALHVATPRLLRPEPRSFHAMCAAENQGNGDPDPGSDANGDPVVNLTRKLYALMASYQRAVCLSLYGFSGL